MLTRRFRAFFLVTVIFLSMLPIVHAGDKQRVWQDGVLLDSSTEKVLGAHSSVVI
jgi:hypothetical protein